MEKMLEGLMKGRKVGRREFLSTAAKLGIVVAGSGMISDFAWASDLGPKESTKFKVPWNVPGGKTFPQGTNLGYLSWEPWCRPYQMKVFKGHTGIDSKTALYKSNKEMFTKLGAGAAKTYDMFSPSHETVKQCVKSGWFQAINRKNVPHYKDLHPEFQNNDYVYWGGKDYMIPFVWCTDAILHNVEKIPEVDSWSFLHNPKYKGKISMVDDAFEGIATMSIYLGFDDPYHLSEDQLQKIKEELIKIKPNLRTFHTSDPQAVSLMAGGEIWAIAIGRVSMIEPLRKQDVNVKWSWPKEGAYGWFEGLAISTYTENREAAEAFADFCVGEEYGAMLLKDIGYYPCSTACRPNLTEEEIERAYLDKPEVAAKVFWLELPENLDRWEEIWAEVKAA